MVIDSRLQNILLHGSKVTIAFISYTGHFAFVQELFVLSSSVFFPFRFESSDYFNNHRDLV